ncbi:hypothetical protein [Oceanobacillus sp. ISL-73]|nr:hypothetical protein [Oceanobacillus sp. ISL-73]
MKEQLVLQERRTIAYKLHDKLQSNFWNDLQNEKSTFLLENSQTEVTFDFETEQRILTGCAQWVNIKHRQEEYCLHGKSPR